MKLNPESVSYLEDFIEVKGLFETPSRYAFVEAIKSSNVEVISIYSFSHGKWFQYVLKFYSYEDYSSFSKTYDILTSPTVEKVRKPKIKVLIHKKFESIIKTLKELIN